MIFPDQRSWETWQVTHEAHRFFVLRWMELFSESTHDSWQVRTSNTRTMLQEMLETLSIAETHEPYLGNMRFLLAEARHATSLDPVLASHAPFTRPYIKGLEALYKNLRDGNRKDSEALGAYARVMLGNLAQYRQAICSRIRILLSDPPEKYKNALYSLTMCLGTELAAMGYSTPFLRDSARVLRDPTAGDFMSRFERFIGRFDGSPKQYRCTFLVRLPDEDQLPESGPYGLELSRDRPEGDLSATERNFYEQDTMAVTATVGVEALEPTSARHVAEQHINALFAMYRLYRLSKTAGFRGGTALVTDGDGECCGVGPDTSRLSYIRDTRDAPGKLVELSGLLKTLRPDDAELLMACLQYHRLAVTASTDAVRLVNLWIALECLVRQSAINIIGAICRFVPSEMSSNHIYRTIKAIGIDLRSLWRVAEGNPLSPLLGRHGTYGPSPQELLAILLEQEGSPRFAALCELAAGNPLFLYRIWRVRDRLLRGPQVLAKAIEGHRQNVEWQIRRIYRARNRIMHRGSSPLSNRHLIQHLHGYLVITVHNLVHDLLKHSDWGVTDALEHRHLVVEHLVRCLRNGQGCLLSPRSLLDTDLALFSQEGAPAWPCDSDADDGPTA